ncbi:hypothetical protein NX801_15400 [Streptomyces sp. LP05-1]|uniref:Secreted protein n=1 Tax=Streptomyces pyxinae TaxID=2970734 RepID=A0ABT2CHY9_9ACTN|nr:hypothetical protein [Streptomyces sp. LP05-1]MCS0637023.1 hypothetical protein [Streptomyces sp. LP05-1]
MRMSSACAAGLSTLALVLGGMTGSATAAGRGQAALACDSPQYLVGSGGHHGASIRCTGGAFTEFIECDKSGYIYTHFGNRALSGGTSTTWCDLNAVVRRVGVTPS